MGKEGFFEKLKRAWNVFRSRDPTDNLYYGDSYSYLSLYSNNSIAPFSSSANLIPAYARIASDASASEIVHAQMDENDKFQSKINSDLARCLTLSANIDQTGRALRQDAIITMLCEGHCALVPINYMKDTENPYAKPDILTMRVGIIKQWYPKHVRVELYDEDMGRRREKVLPKEFISIVENPFYSVMNDRNSTLQRLARKLSLLDITDEKNSDNKFNMFMQLPYALDVDIKREQAERRSKDIEAQLTTSKYGIAYIGASEKPIQLNRVIDTGLLDRVDYFTKELYAQLGISRSILDNTADEQTLSNYNVKIIDPIVSALTDEMTRKFLSEEDLTDHQTITYFTDPFRHVLPEKMAEISDKLTRNAILTSNEVRQKFGYKPSDDPDADILRNKNIAPSDEEAKRIYGKNQNEVKNAEV